MPEGEETPASSNVPRLQREPSVTVIAVTSELFGAMAEDEEQAGEIFRAVERFAQALDAREGGTPGEREYLSVLTTYLRAPFSSLAAEAPAPTPASEKSSAPGEDIDDFFSN